MRLKRNWPMVASALLACLAGYFAWHTVQGDKGWVKRMQLQDRVAAAEQRLSHLRSEREALDHRVRLMRPASLDPDLLDEEARKVLGYSRPGEIVVISPQDTPVTKAPSGMPQDGAVQQ